MVKTLVEIWNGKVILEFYSKFKKLRRVFNNKGRISYNTQFYLF